MSFNIIFIRQLHTTLPQLLRRQVRRANPGTSHQIEVLQTHDDITEDFADLESDLIDVHKSHKQHELEMLQQREQRRLWVVKQKYFKDKFPNFLTYAEKEQIKLLHDRDPEEWDAEKIAESFPASPEVVHKILRGNWKPRSLKRIRQHDEAVIRNWELFRSGGFSELPPTLREHLQKFSDRTRQDLSPKTIDDKDRQPRYEFPQPTTQEFSSIILTCKNYKHNPFNSNTTSLLDSGKTKISVPPKTTNKNDSEDTHLLEKIRDKRQMRLQELKELKLSTNDICSDRKNVPETSLEQRAVEAFGNPSGTGVLPKHMQHKMKSSDLNMKTDDFSLIDKFEANEIVISSEDRKRFEINTVKDRIYIPKKLWRRGAIFKVDDSYYDDDGEFLYRVPGMSKTRI